MVRKKGSNDMIPFNIPPYVGKEIDYIKDAIDQKKICGDGKYTKMCNEWIENNLRCRKALLTTSCTHATEMATLLAEIKEGDEVIMPSFTFVSTADAVVLRGATPVFVDIRPDTMNIDENLIEDAITEKTKAIIPVHYAGVSCEMNTIMDIAQRYHLKVIEDAAQAIGSTYKGQFCGTIGDFGCLSFHETKNLSMGEGGAILIKDQNDVERAEVIREKGTNRSRFWRGEVDKYTWVDAGSSYLPSEINAAYLFAQLEKFKVIQSNRMMIWNMYYKGLESLEQTGVIERPIIPEGVEHNAHMFYIKTKDVTDRTNLIAYLKSKSISAVFHYIPLHNSPAGKKYARFHKSDKFTTCESERLLRLPLYYGISVDNVNTVIDSIINYYEERK